MVVDLPVLIRTGDLQDMEHSVNFTMTNGEQAGRQKGLVASWGSHHTHKLTAGSALLLPYHMT